MACPHDVVWIGRLARCARVRVHVLYGGGTTQAGKEQQVSYAQKGNARIAPNLLYVLQAVRLIQPLLLLLLRKKKQAERPRCARAGGGGGRSPPHRVLRSTLASLLFSEFKRVHIIVAVLQLGQLGTYCSSLPTPLPLFALISLYSTSVRSLSLAHPRARPPVAHSNILGVFRLFDASQVDDHDEHLR